MATFDEDDFFIDQIEAPCEICGLSFPIQLLTEHELLAHTDEERMRFGTLVTEIKNQQPSDIQNTNAVDMLFSEFQDKLLTISQKSHKPKEQSNEQEKDITETQSKEIPISKPNVMFIPKKEQVKETLEVQHAPVDTIFVEPEVIFDESIPEESGTKIMTYGVSKTKNERIEVEKQTYKAPTLLHLSNSDCKEAEIHVTISDDDEESESLENFWKRAEIKLSQKLKKSIKLY